MVVGGGRFGRAADQREAIAYQVRPDPTPWRPCLFEAAMKLARWTGCSNGPRARAGSSNGRTRQAMREGGFAMNDLCRLLSLAVLASLAGCGGGGGGSTAPAPPPPPPPVVVADWQTFQGDAAHTGHVDATYKASAFTSAWTWSMPSRTRNWMNLV